MHDPLDALMRDEDRHLARLTKANLLVLGEEQKTANLVFGMWAVFDEPIVMRCRSERLFLPDPSQVVGTLIVHDVNTLTAIEQDALHDWLWLAGTRRPRVVSTAPVTLLMLLNSQQFSEKLYYRLNTVLVLTEP